MLKKLVLVIAISGIAFPIFCGLLSPGLDADMVPAQVAASDVDPQAVAGAEGSSAVSALMAGDVVGRRGSAFGRRLPVSVFIP